MWSFPRSYLHKGHSTAEGLEGFRYNSMHTNNYAQKLEPIYLFYFVKLLATHSQVNELQFEYIATMVQTSSVEGLVTVTTYIPKDQLEYDWLCLSRVTLQCIQVLANCANRLQAGQGHECYGRLYLQGTMSSICRQTAQRTQHHSRCNPSWCANFTK